MIEKKIFEKLKKINDNDNKDELTLNNTQSYYNIFPSYTNRLNNNNNNNDNDNNNNNNDDNANDNNNNNNNNNNKIQQQ